MNDLRLRIVILNFNRADLTLLCIKSLQKQTFNPIDIVIVDNGSSDDDISKLLSTVSENIILIRSNINQGFSAGNNNGAQFTGLPKPDYILFSNNDVLYPDPDTCTKLICALESNFRSVACSPLVNTIGNSELPEYQIQVRRIPDFLTVLISSSWWLRRIPIFRNKYNSFVYRDLSPFQLNRLIECETINGSCFLIRTEFLEQIGYLDSGTFLYFEEIILGKQISIQNKIAYLVSDTVVNHDQGSTSGHKKNHFKFDMYVWMIKSEIYYCKKYLQKSTFHVCILILVRFFDLLGKLVFSVFNSLINLLTTIVHL